MKRKRLILASTSLRRREILSRSNLVFEVVPSEYEENMSLPMDPRTLAKYLSKGKAQAVADKFQDSVVIGADTFIVYDKKVLGKPHTPEKAKEMLRELSGSVHSIVTGFTIIDTSNSQLVSETIETEVHFKTLSDKEIDEYIATGEPLDRAGAYAIQGLGKPFIDHFVGDYDNAVGLPLAAVLSVLEKFGVQAKTF